MEQKSRVLITGGTGLIGRQLNYRLKQGGYEVALLGRSKRSDSDTLFYSWDPDQNKVDRDAINNCDYIIHLAGANIGAKRWTSKRRDEIISSRVKSIELIFNNLSKSNPRLKAFISASATGYYGAITTGKIFSETDPPAGDFLGQVCEKWEDAADKFSPAGIRTVKLRTGVVLSKQGGALAKLRRPVQWGVGSAIGSGSQYMPWIHLDDLCAMYIYALENVKIKGAYNAVAPEQVTNKAFTRQLARVLHKPFWFPNIPASLMRLLFGRMAVMLLEGSRVSSDKIETAGFSFLYPDLDSAFKDLYS
jgi:uncharacterized protein (TIGR01777 family)